MSRAVADLAEATLRQARLVFAALTAGAVIPLAASGWIDPPGAVPGLAFAASLIGLVSPVIGYRLYALQRERVPSGAGPAQRCRLFLRAGIVALAATEGAALLGVVGYMLSGTLSALSGVLTHVLLVGAIWPTPERLDAFLEDTDAAR